MSHTKTQFDEALARSAAGAAGSEQRQIDMLGGVRVTAPDSFLDVLAEGGSGYHFFGRSAEKVVLVRKAVAFASCAA